MLSRVWIAKILKRNDIEFLQKIAGGQPAVHEDNPAIQQYHMSAGIACGPFIASCFISVICYCVSQNEGLYDKAFQNAFWSHHTSGADVLLFSFPTFDEWGAISIGIAALFFWFSTVWSIWLAQDRFRAVKIFPGIDALLAPNTKYLPRYADAIVPAIFAGVETLMFLLALR